MRTLSDFLSTLPTKTSPNGTEKLTALDGSALVGVPNQLYQVVDGIADLPASIPVGVQILTRDSGTMWRGLVAGESSLPAGTPWPVKGYKEVFGSYLTITKSDYIGVLTDVIGDVGELITISIPGITSISESQYNILVTLGRIDNNVFSIGAKFSAPAGNVFAINSSDSDGAVDSSITTPFYTIRIYPPAPTP
jgi:hypothetical protein